jgi:hypothetical protein
MNINSSNKLTLRLETLAYYSYLHWEWIDISELRKSYPNINEYLIAMINWIYEQEILSKKEILQKYFTLDDSAKQYLQEHWVVFPSQETVKKTAEEVDKII